LRSWIVKKLNSWEVESLSSWKGEQLKGLAAEKVNSFTARSVLHTILIHLPLNETDESLIKIAKSIERRGSGSLSLQPSSKILSLFEFITGLQAQPRSNLRQMSVLHLLRINHFLNSVLFSQQPVRVIFCKPYSNLF